MSNPVMYLDPSGEIAWFIPIIIIVIIIAIPFVLGSCGGGGNSNNNSSPYLSAPAKQGGTLNIGAGQRPIQGAYNIDTNSSMDGVFSGDVYNMYNIQTGSQSKIIMDNPYGYSVLTPEVYRVLETGGTINITGGMSNRYFNQVYNMSDDELKAAGYSVVYRGSATNPNMGLTTDGKTIEGKKMEIILKKN